MLVSTDWLKDFVNLDNVSAKDFYERVTCSICEVEDVIESGEYFEHIRVAQIIHKEKHPDADKLGLITFSLGDEERKVVCGDLSLEVGYKIPYAPVGVTLPIGLTLAPKKIRGIESSGMLCAAEEMGVSALNGRKGVMVLPEDAPIGETLAHYWNVKKDVILDIDNKSLTHRPDLWGHYGMARDIAVSFKTEFKDVMGKKWVAKQKASLDQKEKAPIVLKAVGESALKAMVGISMDIEGLEETPRYIKERIEKVGLRTKNLIVDISNYVMLELGIPNHIYDRSTLTSGELTIKSLAKEETFTTLDEVERNLVAGDTVITDGSTNLCLGGIMGGMNCSVQENTTKLFIEVGNWEPSLVRKTSGRLGLRTDSSQRYEKNLDSNLLTTTLFRLVELIKKHAKSEKTVGSLQEVATEIELQKMKVGEAIETSFERIAKKLGIPDLEESEVERILKGLGFEIAPLEKGRLVVKVPSFRATKDISIEADLVEEVGRHVGYDSITPTSPRVPLSTTSLPWPTILTRKISDFLVSKSECYEVMTYPMIGKEHLEKIAWSSNSEGIISLLNSVTSDRSIMRPTLIGGALETMALNQKNYDQIQFFEIGRTYLPGKKDFADENTHLVIGFFNRDQDLTQKLVSVVDELLHHLEVNYRLSEGVGPKNTVMPANWKGLVPTQSMEVHVMGQAIGGITKLHPRLAKGMRLKGHSALAVLNLDVLLKRPIAKKRKFQELLKYPVSTFDCTVVAGLRTSAETLYLQLKKIKIKELKDYKVIQAFTLDDQRKTFTLRFSFWDDKSTLSSDVLEKAQEKIIETLDKGGFPLKI